MKKKIEQILEKYNVVADTDYEVIAEEIVKICNTSAGRDSDPAVTPAVKKSVCEHPKNKIEMLNNDTEMYCHKCKKFI